MLSPTVPSPWTINISLLIVNGVKVDLDYQELIPSEPHFLPTRSSPKSEGGVFPKK